MSDLLFQCSICSKSLAVDTSMLGRRFVCPQCQTKIHAPTPEIIFRCVHCSCDLCAPEKLCMQDFECPNCSQNVTIPERSVVQCPGCSINIELDRDYYLELSGDSVECPECAGTVPVPAIPGSRAATHTSGAPTVLPKGFGHKTMRLDELVEGVAHAERLNSGTCPYCASKVHVLRDNSFVCKSCGRIMRQAAKA